MESGGTTMCKAVDIEGVAVKATFCSRICVGDSDDSDTEGGLGNVERVVMRPPGHSGKAKRGHLCFDSSFETGNLGRVDFITENEYDLFIRPDTCNPRCRFWFHFAVENVQKNQRIIFNIVNLNRTQNLFQNGLSPVVKSSSRPRWQRLPTENVYYYNSPEHSMNFVLSFAFAFDVEDGERYSFALCYPYSYSRCTEVLKSLAQTKSNIMKLTSPVKSIQGRDLHFVTITEKEDTTNSAQNKTISGEEEEQEEDKRIVFILGRSHAGSSPVSFVIQGLINFLVSDHQVAQDLRRKIIFKIFPMMNPDGVFLGNSRCNLLGADLNRSWHITSKHIPTILAVRDIIMEDSLTGKLDFILDLHSSSNLTGCFIQGNSYDSVYRFERHIVFAKMLSQNCPDFASENTFYNVDPEKEGTARRYFCDQIGEQVNIYSVEFSMFGVIEGSDSLLTSIRSYSEEDYLMHGRRLSRSLWDYFKVNGIIQSNWNPQSFFSGKPTSEIPEGQSGFTMLRLQELSKQREMYSSLESFTSNSDESSENSGDSEGDEGEDEDFEESRTEKSFPTAKKKNRKKKKRNKELDFDYDEFLEFQRMSFFKKSIQDKMEENEDGIKIIGKNILPPSYAETKFLPCDFMIDYSNYRKKKLVPLSSDQIERLLSIERLTLNNSSLKDFEDFELAKEYLKVSKKNIGGGGIISVGKDKSNICQKNVFYTEINPLLAEPAQLNFKPSVRGKKYKKPKDKKVEKVSSILKTDNNSLK